MGKPILPITDELFMAVEGSVRMCSSRMTPGTARCSAMDGLILSFHCPRSGMAPRPAHHLTIRRCHLGASSTLGNRSILGPWDNPQDDGGIKELLMNCPLPGRGQQPTNCRSGPIRRSCKPPTIPRPAGLRPHPLIPNHYPRTTSSSCRSSRRTMAMHPSIFLLSPPLGHIINAFQDI